MLDVNKSKMVTEQIEDLQSRIAFQEDMISKLNDTVVEQGMQLMSLQKQLQHVYKKVKNVSFDDDDYDPVDEKPPHY